jgi:translocation and assembly module TamA
LACVLLLCLWSGTVAADELEVRISGVEEPMLTDVRNRVGFLQVLGETRLSRRRLERLSERAEREALLALRPFGYYHASARAETVETAPGKWQLTVAVDPGPPVTVEAVQIEVTGAGAGLAELQEWRRYWPLRIGQVLDQTVWEAEKQAALDVAEMHGYLGAEFTEHRIELDLERRLASTWLLLDTGPQAVMGEVRFEQDAVRAGILELLPRFNEGQAYDAWLLEKLRLDLWRTGYFENVEIIEERRLEEDPPKVNLVVRAVPRVPNTYQGTLGYGTDTLIRVQLAWSRYLLSERGDSLDMRLGWQERFNQYSFRSNYRLPRHSRAREYWTTDLLVNRQKQDVRVKESDTSEDYIDLTSGNVTDYSLKAGRLVVRDLERGYQQVFETWYGQYVYETVSYDLESVARATPLAEPENELRPYSETASALSVGINWDWPNIRGSAFQTVGHHHRAWVAVANQAWGSDREFNQLYVSSSWHRLLGDRLKLLLRGEVGYTDARVNEFELELPDRSFPLSVTELPNLYRFKAGGSRSVRGYAFESLSNNGIGSNNIVTASAEIEMNFRRDWSLAAFFDAGNAFNDWGEFELRKGAGVGIRWYSLVGAVRLDVAQALDLDGEPWRVHFTIGTPLL